MAILKILLLTVITFIGGSLWFSKLFGKTWMKIHHDKDKTTEKVRKEMRGMWKFMTAEFVLTFIINLTLFFIASASDSLSVALITTLILWFGFILPTTVSNVIWGGDDRKWMVKKIAISSSYRLIAMLFTVWILFIW